MMGESAQELHGFSAALHSAVANAEFVQTVVPLAAQMVERARERVLFQILNDRLWEDCG